MAKWTKEQIEFLEDYAGEVPFAVLIKKYHEKYNLPSEKRTPDAMYKKLSKLGLCGRAVNGDWLCTAAVAKVLGVSRPKVYHWIKRRQDVRNCLKPVFYQRKAFASRARWRQVAREFPELFGGISKERLNDLIEDQVLADQIAKTYKHGMKDYSIMCLETGIIYKSCKEAGESCGIDPHTVGRYARKSQPIPLLGLTFQPLRYPFCLLPRADQQDPSKSLEPNLYAFPRQPCILFAQAPLRALLTGKEHVAG
jgi:hypothetical protein